MKKSDQFTAPISFFKKNSHIMTNNGCSNDFIILSPSYTQSRQMHRSHFNSDNQGKFNDNNFLGKDLQDMRSQNAERTNPNDTQKSQNKRQRIDSFYDDLSSEQSNSNSQTNSSKKFLSNNMSEKNIKSVKSNQEQKYLFINSKKQKNNNLLFSNDIDDIKKQIKKYEISIDKLKEQNMKLRSEKIKLCSNNSSMHVIQYRLQLQSIKKKIKQLEAEKQMHTSIKQDKKDNIVVSNLNLKIHTNNPMTHSCLQNGSSNTDRNQIKQKRNIPTFRQNVEKQIQIGNQPMQSSYLMNQEKGSSQSYKILKNMKSPYFLKNTAK